MLNQIKRAETKISNVEDALVFLEKETLAKKAKVSILFISPAYDRTQLASKIPEILGDHVFGCTTAGEIGPSGYNDDSIVLVSFHGDEFEYNALFLDDLKKMGDAEIQKTEEAVEESAKARAALGESANTFAFMMIDGLSGREEIVVARISSKLGDIPLVGGSAGDKLNFGHTWVWNGVYFSENSALLLLISTTRQFEVFKAQHFVESDKKIVVTSSNPEARIVTEIDGLPAVEAYAHAVGLSTEEFTPMIFSENPVMLKIGDEFFVRSIQKVNSDQSLTFYCAIDDGIVLTVARKLNFLKSAEDEFERIKVNLGEIDAALLSECILRKLEVDGMDAAERQRVQSLYAKNNVIGFHTYGEQFGSLHVNQTLTGVAFGKRRR